MKSNKLSFIKIFLIICLCNNFNASAFDKQDTSAHSTKQEAVKYLSNFKTLEPSSHWPNIDPSLFLENLKLNIENPLSIYAGRGTNFCGYAALSYIPLNNDPAGFVKFMLKLFREGKATMGRVNFKPSAPVQRAAGTLRFKGKMDVRPAEQLWLLVLADHFKGYLNIFNRKYDPGDEDGLWASTNYAKFNRMIRKLFNYKVDASGSDLLRPGKRDLVEYITNRKDSAIKFLYLNNTFLTKKNHGPKRRLPTHFIVLLNITKINEIITITYWENGGKSLQQVTPDFLKKITFGISICSPKKTHV